MTPSSLEAAPAPSSANWRLSRRLLVPVVVLALLLFVVPLVFRRDAYWLNVFTNACFLSFASLGVWITFAIGRVNMAQAAFAMIGGYVTAMLSVFLGISFWLCLPVACAAAVLVGVLVGWPLLRLKGVYFAMVTLSLTEAVRLSFLNLTTLTGMGGISNVPLPPGIGDSLSLYLFSAVLLLIGILAVWRLAASRLGRIFQAMRQSEELASSIGIDVAFYRVVAFGFCSGMGGIAGACFLMLQRNIFPGTYTVSDSINMLLYCFVGGLSFIFGPVVGAFGLTILFELLGGIQQYQALLYGVLMITMMMVLPNGILSLAIRRRTT